MVEIELTRNFRERDLISDTGIVDLSYLAGLGGLVGQPCITNSLCNETHRHAQRTDRYNPPS